MLFVFVFFPILKTAYLCSDENDSIQWGKLKISEGKEGEPEPKTLRKLEGWTLSGIQVRWLALDRIRDNSCSVLWKKAKYEGWDVTRFRTCGSSLQNDSMFSLRQEAKSLFAREDGEGHDDGLRRKEKVWNWYLERMIWMTVPGNDMKRGFFFTFLFAYLIFHFFHLKYAHLVQHRRILKNFFLEA